MTKLQQSEQEEARATLRKLCPPGTTVYTILNHVSRSGMQRRISAYTIDKPSGEPQWLVGYIAKATSFRRHHSDRDTLVLGGCGMDMGFHLVYELSHVLYPDGYGCIGKGCPSNDHSNGDRDYTPHAWTGTFAPDDASAKQVGEHYHWHRDGGYALKHRWL